MSNILKRNFTAMPVRQNALLWTMAINRPNQRYRSQTAPTWTSFSRTSSAFYLCSASMPLSKAQAWYLQGEKFLLTCRGRGVAATGYESSQGFVVRAGSYASRLDEVPSLVAHFDNVCQLRAKLTKNGEVLVPEGDKLRFTIDYTFNSSIQFPPGLCLRVLLMGALTGRIPQVKL